MYLSDKPQYYGFIPDYTYNTKQFVMEWSRTYTDKHIA